MSYHPSCFLFDGTLSTVFKNMATAVSKASEFKDYPSLSKEEFSEVCHHFDRRYRQATLGSVRRQWKLNICTALDTSFALDADYTTYVQIIRPLQGELDHGDLSTHLDSFSFAPVREEVVDDHEAMEIEEQDEVRLFSSRTITCHHLTAP